MCGEIAFRGEIETSIAIPLVRPYFSWVSLRRGSLIDYCLCRQWIQAEMATKGKKLLAVTIYHDTMKCVKCISRYEKGVRNKCGLKGRWIRWGECRKPQVESSRMCAVEMFNVVLPWFSWDKYKMRHTSLCCRVKALVHECVYREYFLKYFIDNAVSV